MTTATGRYSDSFQLRNESAPLWPKLELQHRGGDSEQRFFLLKPSHNYCVAALFPRAKGKRGGYLEELYRKI
jgi:hypothetical protein